MMQQSPQSTHNKTDDRTPSAYERVSSEIENFIRQVAEEEKRNNTVLHTKAGVQEKRKPSLLRQITQMIYSPKRRECY